MALIVHRCHCGHIDLFHHGRNDELTAEDSTQTACRVRPSRPRSDNSRDTEFWGPASQPVRRARAGMID